MYWLEYRIMCPFEWGDVSAPMDCYFNVLA